MEQTVNICAIKRLKKLKKALTRQEYCTLKGQILAGEGEAAIRGMQNILERKRRKCANDH